MSTTVTKTVAGRPVTGEIERQYSRQLPEQKPIEDFVAALDELFAFPEVEAVRWSQYTPSFNDGDPCVFSTGEFTVKLTGIGTDDEDDDGYDEDYPDGFVCEYGVDRAFGVEYDYKAKNHHPIAAALENNLGYSENKAFYHALEDAFGDPAEVTATREGFNVEYYDCGH